MNPAVCPDQAELSRFVLGNLSSAELARVADHLERCGTCEQAVQKLEELTDPLVSGLQAPADDMVSAVSTVPHHLLSAARSARASANTAITWSADGQRRLGKFELLE